MVSDEDEPEAQGDLRPCDRNYGLMSKNLQDFQDFLNDNSSDLLSRPSNTLQAAANLPSGTHVPT